MIECETNEREKVRKERCVNVRRLINEGTLSDSETIGRRKER